MFKRKPANVLLLSVVQIIFNEKHDISGYPVIDFRYLRMRVRGSQQTYQLRKRDHYHHQVNRTRIVKR